jgi:hypothetical protein
MPNYTQQPMQAIAAGDTVRALHSPIGQDHEGTEWMLDFGSLGTVHDIDTDGHVTVLYWVDPHHHVVQVYSEADDDIKAIELVSRNSRLVCNRAVTDGRDTCGEDYFSSASRQHYIDTGRWLYAGRADLPE